MSLLAWVISGGGLVGAALCVALWWSRRELNAAYGKLRQAEKDRDDWVRIADTLERQVVAQKQAQEERNGRLERVNEEISKRLLERDAEVEAIVRDLEKTHGAVSARELLDRLRRTSPSSTAGAGIVVSV